VNALDAARDGSPASTAPTPVGSPSADLSLRLRLDRLQDFEGAALREEWRRLCRSEPPRISRDLLLRAIAYRLQELEFGGLPRWARQTLAASVINADSSDAGEPVLKPAEPRLKPGARLIREWHGRMHTVIVLDDGFEFEGRRYRSLTPIACEITGAHWSGPRFFGLSNRKGQSGADEGQGAPIDAEEASRVARPKQPEDSAYAWRGAAGSGEAVARRSEQSARGEGGHG
jgi:Protein of unknown function (DUF2924)